MVHCSETKIFGEKFCFKPFACSYMQLIRPNTVSSIFDISYLWKKLRIDCDKPNHQHDHDAKTFISKIYFPDTGHLDIHTKYYFNIRYYSHNRVNLKIIILSSFQVYRETARNKGWVDLYTPPLYAPDNGENKDDGTSEEFIIRAPLLDGKNGYYRHIMRVSLYFII